MEARFYLSEDVHSKTKEKVVFFSFKRDHVAGGVPFEYDNVATADNAKNYPEAFKSFVESTDLNIVVDGQKIKIDGYKPVPSEVEVAEENKEASEVDL